MARQTCIHQGCREQPTHAVLSTDGGETFRLTEDSPDHCKDHAEWFLRQIRQKKENTKMAAANATEDRETKTRRNVEAREAKRRSRRAGKVNTNQPKSETKTKAPSKAKERAARDRDDVIPSTQRDLKTGTKLTASYKGKSYTLEVVQEGDTKAYALKPRIKGQPATYRSPSAAGKAVMGGIACNGWRFWSIAS